MENGNAPDLARIKRNVAKMASMNAPEADIDGYILSEGVTIEQVRAFPLDRAGRADQSPEMTAALADASARSRSFKGLAGKSPGVDRPSRNIQTTGVVENAGAGLDSGVNSVLGAPVDLARAAINAVTQPGHEGPLRSVPIIGDALRSTQMISQAVGVKAIPDNTVGSRKFWDATQEAAGFTPPDAVVPANIGEQLARASGEAIGNSIIPELAVTRLATAGNVSNKVAQVLEDSIGTLATPGRMATSVAVNAGAGAGAEAAAEAAPDNFKPLAQTLGGLAGGGGAAIAALAPRGVKSATGAVVDAVAPKVSQNAREDAAGRLLRDNASSPGQVVDAIGAAPASEMPSAAPTTFQQTGDLGLGALERQMMNAPRQTEKFTQRRADQNTARLGALKGIGPGGNPSSVAKAVREHLEAADGTANKAADAATIRARRTVETLGDGTDASATGDQIRSAWEAGRAISKQRESALHAAVDPDGTLAMGAGGTRKAADDIMRDLPASAKPPEGEEAAIFGIARNYSEVVPYRELSALHSRIKSAMMEERATKGRTPAWRRLSMLSSAIFDDMDKAVRRTVMRDNAAVTRGEMLPGETVAARISDATAPMTGKTVYTPAGRRIGVEYEVREADDLVPSQLDDLRPNPRFDAGLQPRDRSRAASDVQIARIASELQPERLGPSASAAEGAPIVSADGMVESGNARVLALRRAYAQNGPQAAAYRAYLAEQGFDTGSMAKPVLVRRRTEDLAPADRLRFVQEANAPTTLTMSAGERARTDASRLSPELLAEYRGGDLDDAGNRGFVRGFLKSVADQGEEGAFTTADGRLSLEGTQRMRGALLHAAYDDAPLVEALIETGDENIRTFGRALTDLAGDVARLKAGIKSGQIDAGADLSKPLVEAARLVQEARRKGMSIADAVAQQDAFARLSDDAVATLRLAYGPNLTGRLSRERFNEALKPAIAEATMQTNGVRLFGDASSASDILSGVVARNGTTDQAPQQSYRVSPSGQGVGTSWDRGGGPRDGTPRPSSTEARGRDGSERILEQPKLEPNFDQAALDRLTAARKATAERARTFDNPTLAPLMKRPSETAPYNVRSSDVAARIFRAGARAKDDIAALRRAIGDDKATPILRNYAASKARAAALREDGTFDPAKLATFRRSHREALAELPGLDKALSTAGNASKLAEQVAKDQRDTLIAEQRGVLGDLLRVSGPDDVVSTVGAMFGRKDSVTQFQRLSKAIEKDPEAKGALQQTVADFITKKFVSNTEAGTSEQNLLRADQFQTFVRVNKGALEAAGFSDSQVRMLEAIAESVHQANRSIASIKVPGGPGTAQDLLKSALGEKVTSILGRALVSGTAGAGLVSVLMGNVLGLGVAGGAILLNAARQHGLNSIDDIVVDALLHPERARLLILKAAPKQRAQAGLNLAQMYRRAAAATTTEMLRGESARHD